jgi:glycosyltransferase involved in cell wall biosynthesis
MDIYFSVIIPVYNVEKYLERCLDSILNQGFEYPFEVIAINDASTDSSLQILINYQNKYKKLRVISNSYNSKLSITRYNGFKQAKGKYIINVDSDDWLVDGALNGIYKYLEFYKADILVFNYKRQNSLGKVVYNQAIEEHSLHYDKIQVIDHFLGACWNKVVKRDLLNDIIYGQYSLNSQEDLIYSFEILNKSKSILLIKETYYVYFDNLTSITRAIMPSAYLQTQPFILSELNKIFNKYHPDKSMKDVVFDYLEKYIYEAVAQIQFIGKSKDLHFCKKLIIDLSTNSLLTNNRITLLNRAIENRWISLVMVYKYYSLRKVLSILFRSIHL